jgi:hypothetical protein
MFQKIKQRVALFSTLFFLFSLFYPSKTGAEESYADQTYTNVEFGYFITYPSDWDINWRNDTPKEIIFRSKGDPNKEINIRVFQSTLEKKKEEEAAKHNGAFAQTRFAGKSVYQFGDDIQATTLLYHKRRVIEIRVWQHSSPDVRSVLETFKVLNIPSPRSTYLQYRKAMESAKNSLDYTRTVRRYFTSYAKDLMLALLEITRQTVNQAELDKSIRDAIERDMNRSGGSYKDIERILVDYREDIAKLIVYYRNVDVTRTVTMKREKNKWKIEQEK